MKLINIFIFQIFSNAVAILAAAHFIKEGFIFNGGFKDLLLTALILSVANIFLKPLLKLFLGPFIILTFGLFLIVINALILYLLDILSQPLIINGYLPLLLGAIIISLVNFIINLAAKNLYQKKE